MNGLCQGLREDPGQRVDGADVEGAHHVAQLRRVVGAHEVLGFLHDPADLGAQFERPRGQHQAAAGAHQKRVAKSFTSAGEGAAHGRRTQVETPGGFRDALLAQ